MDEVLDRPQFQKRAREEIARSKRFNRPFVLVLLEAQVRSNPAPLRERLSKGLQVVKGVLRECDRAYKVFDDLLAVVLLETDLQGAEAAAFRLR